MFFDKGIVSLSEGDTLVIGAAVDSNLGALDRSSTRLLTRYSDVHTHFSNAGWSCSFDPGAPAANVIVLLPQARAAQRASIKLARSLTEGPIIVDGPKTHGVDAAYRELRKRADVSEAWSKAHGKIFTVTGGDFDDWPDLQPSQHPDGWWRAPGVFSADGIDPASALLAEALPTPLKGSVIDLGAGWGYLSRAILERDGVTQLALVENDHIALEAAKLNIDHEAASFHLADARTWRPDTPADHVVTNPPFHIGRATDPDLGRAFIQTAAAIRNPKGHSGLSPTVICRMKPR